MRYHHLRTLLALSGLIFAASCAGDGENTGNPSENLFSSQFDEIFNAEKAAARYASSTGDTSLQGYWNSEVYNTDGVTIESRVKIESNSMIIAARCTKEGKTSSPSINVPITIDAAKAELITQEDRSTKVGICPGSSSLKKGSVTKYSISGNSARFGTRTYKKAAELHAK